MKLKKEELLELFNSSVDNAFFMYKCSKKILLELEKNKYPSLGLAELALEELGKSFTCLAYYSKAQSLDDWKDFWKDWKNHDLKAHRAFFYEFFSLLRLEMEYENEDDALEFPSVKGNFSKEKEASFYVDIDKGNRKIHKPENEISDEECIRRVTSLLGLFNAAFFIQDWFKENSNEDFRNAISDYAFRTISTEMYQQDVLNVLKEMENENAEYNKGLGKIKSIFKPE
jgi:AbiV family abortive infection protein